MPYYYCSTAGSACEYLWVFIIWFFHVKFYKNIFHFLQKKMWIRKVLVCFDLCNKVKTGFFFGPCSALREYLAADKKRLIHRNTNYYSTTQQEVRAYKSSSAHVCSEPFLSGGPKGLSGGTRPDIRRVIQKCSGSFFFLQSFITWNLGSWSTCRSWTLRTAWAEYFCGSGIHTCHIVGLRASRLMGHRHSGSWKAFWFWGRLAWATGQEPPARRHSQVSDILSKFTVFGCKDFGGWDKWGRSKKRNGQQLCQVTSTSFLTWGNVETIKYWKKSACVWPPDQKIPLVLDLRGPDDEPSEDQSPVRVVEGLMILTSVTFGFNRRYPRCQDITVMWLIGHKNQLWFFLLNRK